MDETDIRPGELVTVADGLQRLTAANASPMTGPGTNTYIVGDGPYVIVDPGVEDRDHLDRLYAATGGAILAVLLTHRHPDHASGAATLAARADVPVRAWPKVALSQYDLPVAVDALIADGEIIEVGHYRLVARHTPGHAADHLCFELPETGILLAGDCVMADATVVILPPDGDMGDYFATLDRLLTFAVDRIAPAHGGLLTDVRGEITDVISHRRARERQILAALSPEAIRSADGIAQCLYPQLYDHLHTMAAMQVQAHLLHLAAQGQVVDEGSGWRLTSETDGAVSQAIS